MTSTPKGFHLGWFADEFRIPARNPAWAGTSSVDRRTAPFHVDTAGELERACFDFVMLEDSNYIPDDYGGSTEIRLKIGQHAPMHDPSVLASIVTAKTDRPDWCDLRDRDHGDLALPARHDLRYDMGEG